MHPDVMLRDARLPGVDRPHDVLLRGGRVAAVTPAGGPRPAPAGVRAGGVRLDGRWLWPGLWDEHVHFTQWVKHRSRVDLAGTASAAEVVDVVRRAMPAGPARAGATYVVGYGFRDGLWPDRPTRAALDALDAHRPIVLISKDLHCGWLNSAAAALLGADPGAGTDPDDSGLLRETAWIGTLDRLDRETAPGVDDYRAGADAAARRGVVGVVDFENADNLRLWPQRVAGGVTALRVEASIWPARLPAAIAAGHRTGAPLDRHGLVTVGRLKVVVDGSLNTRTALCWDPYPGTVNHGVQAVAPTQLRDLLATAHRAGIRPAVHAIGDRANTQVIDEFERLGIPGVIEHAQLVAEADFARFGRLGLVASVQPEHAMDDRDVADRYWAGRTGRSFAYRSLLDAGATLRLGSDAPVSPLDPWAALAAAVDRSRDGRDPWHPEQALPRAAALAASARGRTTVVVGDPADLVVLDHDPTGVEPRELRDMTVAGTLLAGRWTWNGLEQTGRLEQTGHSLEQTG
ncbi:amidohydrolase [Solwaraspora sp. WMMB335]|uniref:amidohydrolase n=1 Tax=Solwaraspora sp. WMMB335 TaxID=3404118 RepID=UPI003B94D3D1